MTREKLKDIVEEKIDDAFKEYFDDMKIETGDIHPLQAFRLDQLEEEIVDMILVVAEQNMGADEHPEE